MTDEERPWNERSVTKNQRILPHLQYYEMDYSHTYIFIPKAFRERKDDVLHCVRETQAEDYVFIPIDCESNVHSNL